MLENLYSVCETEELERFEQENLIFVPVEADKLSNGSLHVTDGFPYHRYTLDDPYVFNITEKNKIYLYKTIPKVDLQMTGRGFAVPTWRFDTVKVENLIRFPRYM